jgi:hypothetical protein
MATLELSAGFNRRDATRTANNAIPALKRRAKFIPALRAEDNRLLITDDRLTIFGAPGNHRPIYPVLTDGATN